MCPNCGYCPTCGRSNGQHGMPFYPYAPIPWYVGSYPVYAGDNITGTSTDVQTPYTNTCSDPFHTHIVS